MGTWLLLFAIVLQTLQVLVSVVETHQQRFVLKGQDVRLDLEQVNVTREDDFTWTFDVDVVVVVYIPKLDREPVREKYRSKAEFSSSNFSLLLKNLTEEDSGLYEAKTTGDKVQTVASYLVSVLERVDRPVLKVLSSSPSGDSCNVNCSAQGLSITSSCNSSSCAQVGEVSGGGGASANLSVKIVGGSIICNYSNQASWEQDTLVIEHCSLYPQEHTGLSTGVIAVVIAGICVLVIAVGFFLTWRCFIRHRNKRIELDPNSTTYATVHNGGQVANPDPVCDRMTPHDLTIYSTVQHPKPVVPDRTESPIPTPAFESVYAQVNKPSKQ